MAGQFGDLWRQRYSQGNIFPIASIFKILRVKNLSPGWDVTIIGCLSDWSALLVERSFTKSWDLLPWVANQLVPNLPVLRKLPWFDSCTVLQSGQNTVSKWLYSAMERIAFCFASCNHRLFPVPLLSEETVSLISTCGTLCVDTADCHDLMGSCTKKLLTDACRQNCPILFYLNWGLVMLVARLHLRKYIKNPSLHIPND